MPKPAGGLPRTEAAKLLTADYRDAILKVRDTIAAEPALRTEEWSSLTKHVTELYVLERFGYLRCCSGDSLVDGIIPLPGETDIRIDPEDAAFLLARGIQVKGRRVLKGRYGTTGDVKLGSRFKYLYAVWVNESYRVIEAEVYRLEYPAVEELIGRKTLASPKGKNTRKISRAEAASLGVRVPLVAAPALTDGQELIQEIVADPEDAAPPPA